MRTKEQRGIREIIIPASKSQAFFTEALLTIPCTPYRGELYFLAEGISLPRFYTEKVREEYLTECAKHNVMPYTDIEFAYSDEGRLFNPRNADPILGISERSSYSNVDKVAIALLNGGRFHQIKLDLGRTWTQPSNYQRFKDSFLPLLQQNGYQIKDADLWLSSYSLTGYSQGTYKANGLDLGILGDGKAITHLNLNYDDDLAREKGAVLADWFKNLRKTHFSRKPKSLIS